MKKIIVFLIVMFSTLISCDKNDYEIYNKNSDIMKKINNKESYLSTIVLIEDPYWERNTGRDKIKTGFGWADVNLEFINSDLYRFYERLTIIDKLKKEHKKEYLRRLNDNYLISKKFIKRRISKIESFIDSDTSYKQVHKRYRESIVIAKELLQLYDKIFSQEFSEEWKKKMDKLNKLTNEMDQLGEKIKSLK